MTLPSDKLAIAKAFAKIQYPHKDWSMIADCEKTYILMDADDILRAIREAGYDLVKR